MRTERGATLVELVVGMLVLGVFLTICGSGVLSLTRSTRLHTRTVNAQFSTRQAFFLLDKQIRYADAVTTPATISGEQWIEWRVPADGQSRCYQWRASGTSAQLQFRTWIVPASGGVAVPGWTTVVTGLSIGSQPVFTTGSAALSAAPFGLPAATSSSLPYARVGVALTVPPSSTGTAGSTVSTVFTALNAVSSGSGVCTEVPRS